ncbi:MAG: hypothetical protein IIU38_01810, partial [Bacteroidaceae bacterium]|nr:hypothetical protein [Bacteroidaceae bacterium]
MSNLQTDIEIRKKRNDFFITKKAAMLLIRSTTASSFYLIGMKSVYYIMPPMPGAPIGIAGAFSSFLS